MDVPTKANISAIEGNNASLDVMYNPKEVSIDKSVPWQKHKNSEADAAKLEFTAAEPMSLSCELTFDTFESKGDVYEQYVSVLESMALIDDGLKRPPMVKFTWNNLKARGQVFQGVIESIGVKYTLFLADGTPCRATVNLKLKEAAEASSKMKGASGAQTPAKTPTGKTVTAGQHDDNVATGTTPAGSPDVRGVRDQNGGNSVKPGDTV